MITNTSLFWFLLNLYILYYRRQFVIFRTACYSIKQRSKLILFCCCNGLTSKHLNSFLIVFYCLTSIYLFCFCETNFDVFTVFSELSVLKRNVLFMEIYTSMKSSILSLTKYTTFLQKKRRKKLFFNCLQEVIFSQIFSRFECKYVLINILIIPRFSM